MKYTLTIEADIEHDLKDYIHALDYYSILCALRDEARKLWKYSQDEAEIAKGEWLRDLLHRECNERGVEI